MFSMRYGFSVMVISMIWFNSTFGKSNDRMDQLIATVVQMSKRMDRLVQDVGKIKENEEDMENLVIHMKESMKKLAKTEDIDKQVNLRVRVRVSVF